MNPKTSVGHRHPDVPVRSASRAWRTLDESASRQFLDLVDRGQLPAWARPAAGAGLVALGLAALVSNLVGGGS